MKFESNTTKVFARTVAPGMGAWIEIALGLVANAGIGVAPGMGAWIEILSIRGG